MPTSVARQAAPPWRVLLWLATAVLLIHALVLGASPLHFGPTPPPAAKQVPAMLTRSIAPPPAPVAAATTQPPVQPRPRAAPKKKAPVAQAQPAPQPSPEPAPLTAEAPSLPEPPAQEATALSPTETATTPTSPASVDTAGAGAPAASAAASAAAPATPPAGANQTPVTAMALPASVALDYQMSGSAKGLTYHAKGELLWHNNAGSYDARMTVSALFIGSRSMSSQGQIGAQGLAPTRFADKSRTEVAAHFEPDKGQVSFSANTPSVPWVKGGQDRVSLFVQLGGMLAGNPAAFPVGSTISLYTVGPRDADTWTFQVEGEEVLSLPFGELATLKLSRQLRHENDQKLEVWYAPSLGYLPVRNKITQANGDFVDQQLSAVNRP